jgi:hypothetical protein
VYLAETTVLLLPAQLLQLLLLLLLLLLWLAFAALPFPA